MSSEKPLINWKILFLGISLILLVGCELTDQKVTVTDFDKTLVLVADHDNHSDISVLKMKVSTSLNRSMDFEIIDRTGYRSSPHYQFTLPAQGQLDISIDWYFPEVDIIFVDAENVRGSVDIEYFL